MIQQHKLLLVLLILGVISHFLIHVFSLQLAAAGRRAVRLVASHREGVTAAALQHAEIPHFSFGDSSATSRVERLNPPLKLSRLSSGCESAAARPEAAVLPGTEAPRVITRLSVLVVHEHHLKAIGSDLRLLGVLLQLRSLGHTASFLARGKVPPAQRSPPTAELLRLLGSSETAEALLSAHKLPRPPTVYEYVDLPSLSLFAKQGWFDVVLCSFWFWRDPMPSAAELLLPSLALHSPTSRRPFIAILSDDAHSAKAQMMAEWEVDLDRKRMWQLRVQSLPRRQHAVYSMADAVIHISEIDQALELRQFNQSCRHWLTLPMSPRGFSGDHVSAAEVRPASGGLVLGFMGNGATPTNYLAVEWFLHSVWPSLRQKVRAARLRLVGFPPDDRPKKLQGTPCAAGSTVRCGWGWGTEYASSEVEHGIESLGFLSDKQMAAELSSWSAMVVPILRSTGVNTKLFPALQLGIPIVLTSVAASPLRIPLDDSVALIADSALQFETQILRLHSQPEEKRRLAAASLRHWQLMLDADASASEMSHLLQLVCPTIGKPTEERPLPLPSAPTHAAADLPADLATIRRPAPHSRCFPSAARQPARTPAILVLMHGQSAGEQAALLAHAVWEAVCEYCELRCVHSRALLRRKEAKLKWDVLLEHEALIVPRAVVRALSEAAAMQPSRPMRLVHMPSNQFAAALSYAERGEILASVARSENMRSQLPPLLADAGLPDTIWDSLPMFSARMNESLSLSQYTSEWRRVVAALGVPHTQIDHLVKLAISLRNTWTKERPAPKWVGCFRDRGERTMASGPRTFGHTSQACAGACTGYAYFALQNGGQCFCSRTVPKAGNHSKVADSKCGSTCVSEDQKKPPRRCGGSWRSAVYSNPCA